MIHPVLTPCRSRIQLLPMFLALAGFGLQHGKFQMVFIDGGPRNWCDVLAAALLSISCSKERMEGGERPSSSSDDESSES